MDMRKNLFDAALKQRRPCSIQHSESSGSPEHHLDTSLTASDSSESDSAYSSIDSQKMDSDFDSLPLSPKHSSPEPLSNLSANHSTTPPSKKSKMSPTNSLDQPSPENAILSGLMAPSTSETTLIRVMPSPAQSVREMIAEQRLTPSSYISLAEISNNLPRDDREMMELSKQFGGFNKTHCQPMMDLISRGFLPKHIFKCLISDRVTDEDSDRYIYQMKQERLMFLAPNQDARRKIFQKKQCWYFVPIFVLTMKKKLEPVDNVDAVSAYDHCLALTYAMTGSLRPMPWLAGLLYEFCSPYSVALSASSSEGYVGKIKMIIEVKGMTGDQCSISVCCDKSDNSAVQHSTVLVAAVRNIISKGPIFENHLVDSNLVTIKELGQMPKVATDFSSMWSQALKDYESELAQCAKQNEGQIGTTQEMMFGTQNRNGSNISIPSQTESDTSREDSGYDSIFNSVGSIGADMENGSGANLAGLGNERLESEETDTGTSPEELGVILKFMKDKSLAYMMIEKDDRREIFGNGTLVEFCANSKNGLVLTAQHVWEKAQNDLVNVKLFFPNARSHPDPVHPTYALVSTSNSSSRVRAVDDLDYALVKIQPIDSQDPFDLQPLVTDLSTTSPEILWRSWKRLYVISRPVQLTSPIKNFATEYLGRVCKDIAQCIDTSDDGKLRAIWRRFSDENKRFLTENIRYQIDTVKEPCNNLMDAENALSIVKDILKSAEENYKYDYEQLEVIFQQLMKLLHPKRFLIKNGGMTWGNSGSIIIYPSVGGEVVGMFLCGYPEPFGTGFKARHFKIMQGLKLSAVDL